MKQSKIMNMCGIITMCLYIFMSYNAVGIVLPYSMNSIFLYLFIGWGIVSVMASAFTNGRIHITRYTVWYGLFMLVSLISMLYSPEKSLLSGSFYLMIVSFALTFIFQLVIKDEKTFSILCWAYFISAVTLVIMLAVTGNLNGDDGRLGQDFMGNANTFSTMMSVSAMYGLWILIYEKRKLLTRLAITAGIISILYALILSGGRKGFVIPFIFLYGLLIMKADSKGRRHIITYSAIAIVIGIVAYNLVMNVPALYNTLGYRLEGFINGVFETGEQDTSSAIREELQIIALDGWLESPLFGHGFDSFKYLSEIKTGHFFYSHCNYTEMLYNGGIIMFIVYYYIYFFIAKSIRINKECLPKYRAFAVALILAFIVYDFAGISYTNTTALVMISSSLTTLSFKTET